MYYSDHVHLFNPKLFDPLKHLSPKLHHVQEEARILLDLLVRKRMHNPKLAEHNLKAEYIRKFVDKNCNKLIRDDFVYHGVITCDFFKVIGSKSYSYALTPKFSECGIEPYLMTTKKLVRRLGKIRSAPNRFDVDNQQLNALEGWLSLLRVDYGAARDFLDHNVNEREQPERYGNLLISLMDVADCKAGIHRVDERGRVYSGATNLWKQFRQFLSVNGERLVNCDVVSSQPLFLSLLAVNNSVNKEEMRLNERSFNRYVNKKETTSPPLPCIRWEFSHLPPDVLLFKQLCQQGTLYEYLMRQFSIDDRNKVKRMLFKFVLYAKNHHHSRYRSLFYAEFPSVAAFIEETKKGNYKALPLLIQHVEANFVIKTVCKILTEERPDVPLITIHDSILTTEGNADLVRQVMLREFRKLGVDGEVVRLEG